MCCCQVVVGVVATPQSINANKSQRATNYRIVRSGRPTVSTYVASEQYAKASARGLKVSASLSSGCEELHTRL